MSKLLTLMGESGPDIYYTPQFRQIVEDHLTYLKDHPSTETITIDPQTAVRGDGDLVSVLLDYTIPKHQHWMIMRLNGMSSPMDYTQDRTTLRIPGTNVLEQLIKRFRVTQRIINPR